ncbi:MAG: hypothetical protein LLG01_03465 [Planctomycetaceae bacterium]|nr:hypothetical protein [Planctomycetaceae bacterium]
MIALLVAAVALAAWGFRHRRTELTIFIVLAVMQISILLTWVAGITTAAVFEESSDSWGAIAQQRILPPELEAAVMRVFWTAATVLAVIWAGLWLVHMYRKGFFPRQGKGLRVSAVLLLIFSLLCLVSNIHNYRRSPLPPYRSMSPDGRIEAAVVPMDCMIDVEGILIHRQPGEFWYRLGARVGDILGLGISQMEWPSNMRLRMVFSTKNNYSMTYDFETGKMETSGTRPTWDSGGWEEP